MFNVCGCTLVVAGFLFYTTVCPDGSLLSVSFWCLVFLLLCVLQPPTLFSVPHIQPLYGVQVAFRSPGRRRLEDFRRNVEQDCGTSGVKATSTGCFLSLFLLLSEILQDDATTM